jgi:hypothetical protein
VGASRHSAERIDRALIFSRASLDRDGANPSGLPIAVLSSSQKKKGQRCR